MGDMQWDDARGAEHWSVPARRATFARSAAATPRAPSARDEPQRNARRDRLREVAELPRAFQSLFSSFKYFNGIQAEMIDYILSTSRSFVVSACARRARSAPASRRARRRLLPPPIFRSHSCVSPLRPGAPTGSGKTVLLELAILQMLLKRVDRNTGAFEHRPGELKAIYMAPLKALVQEKKEEWISRFGPLGVVCKELTGDADVASWSELTNVDIILTTPEKFDSITRKNKDRGGMAFFGDLALVMIDEVHLLGDERGGALEAVISRLKVLSERASMRAAPLGSVRFAACSATVSNLDDVGRWLCAPSPEGTRRFGEEYRPVTLETKVLGYDPAKNDYLFERRLNDRLMDVVTTHYDGKPALVFCNSRDGAASAAKELASKASTFRSHPFVRDGAHRSRLAEAASRVSCKALAQTIPHGVGFHTSALEYADRDLCEQLFRGRILTVLCCTSTLAMGVNLPAFLCVVRGTRQYAGSGTYREMERGTLLQMCGRAGRPQFDVEGRAVIMTQRSTVGAYVGLVHGTDPIESNLGLAMPEHINAEIAGGIVTDAATAVDWLRHSFFFIRVGKNPRHYDVAPGVAAEQACDRIARDTLRELADARLCETADVDGAGGEGSHRRAIVSVRPLEGGRVMSDMYIRFRTMRLLMEVSSPASVSDLLETLSRAEEFSQIKLRREEKKILKEWNLSEEPIVRFKVTEARGKAGKRAVAKVIRTPAEKIFVATQEAMSDEFATVLPPGMRLEVENVFTNGRRIMRGAARYYAKTADGGFAACCNALRLSKALEMRAWDDTRFPMRQIPQCGKKSILALAAAGYLSLDDVAAADPRALERVVNRQFPHGDHLIDAVLALPAPMRLSLTVEEAWNGGVVVSVCLRRSPAAAAANRGRSRLPNAPPAEDASPGGPGGVGGRRWNAHLIVGCKWRDTLLHFERISRDALTRPGDGDESGTLLRRVVRCGTVPRPGEDVVVAATIIFEGCVGRDVHDVVTCRVPRHGRITPLMSGGGAVDAATPPARRALGKENENENAGRLGEPATPAPPPVAFAKSPGARRPSIVSASVSPVGDAPRPRFAQTTLPRLSPTAARDGDDRGYGPELDDAAPPRKTQKVARAPSVDAARAFRDDACGMELDMDWDGDW